MQEDIQQKQKYLCTEILEAGYDAEHFISFMNGFYTSQAPLLEQLTKNDLVKMVQLYKQDVQNAQNEKEKNFKEHHQEKQINQQTKQLRSPSQIQKHKQSLNKQEKQQKSHKIVYDKQGTFDIELKGTYNCRHLQKPSTIQQIKISIPTMQTKVNEGFLFGLGAKTQCLYHIQSNLQKKPIKRLLEDFDWLNITIQRLYPYLITPELQPLKKDPKDPYLFRQKQIEQYLQHLAQKKQIMSSKLFFDFLTIPPEKMEQSKKLYDHMQPPSKGITQLETVQGNIEVDLSNRTRKFSHVSKKFTEKTAQLHQSINQSISKMIDSYRVAIEDTYKVVDYFAELHDSFNEMTQHFQPLQKQLYKDVLINLNHLFLGLGDSLNDITNSLDKHIKDYYRFECGLDHSLARLQRYLRTSKIDHIEFKQNLRKKKQKIITDPSKWQIDNPQLNKKFTNQDIMKMILPKDNNTENQNKLWYAFNLKNYQKQMHSYVKFLSRRYQKVYVLFCNDLLLANKKYSQAVSKFASQYQGQAIK